MTLLTARLVRARRDMPVPLAESEPGFVSGTLQATGAGVKLTTLASSATCGISVNTFVNDDLCRGFWSDTAFWVKFGQSLPKVGDTNLAGSDPIAALTGVIHVMGRLKVEVLEQR